MAENGKSTYEIHPRIGVARIGNSTTEFYLAPTATGGLPTERDLVADDPSRETAVEAYKDELGRVKRQIERFRIFKRSADGVQELTLGNGLSAISWTAHIANKKASWYTFSELVGDWNLGEWNSYENQKATWNNPDTTDVDERRKLIIDPGPRTVSRPGEKADFSRDSKPENYDYFSFPPIDPSKLFNIDTLGGVEMDKQGRLLAWGGVGRVMGSTEITSFRGAPGYHDDVADGYVVARITLDDSEGGETLDLDPAWLIVGSPKVAPGIVNYVTLDDTIYDMGVRHLGFERVFDAPPPKPPKCKPELLSPDSPYDPTVGFNSAYVPNFQRDIKPLFDRAAGYKWVANVPTMDGFARPNFDPGNPNPTAHELAKRKTYFEYFRLPVPGESYAHVNVNRGPNQLMYDPDQPDGPGLSGVPMMPINSGDNSVTNDTVYKFLTVTPTQYFFLKQWSEGNCDYGPAPQVDDATALDIAATGNCVGGPFSPGIECTWTVRNPTLFRAPRQLAAAYYGYDTHGSISNMADHYAKHGLNPCRDEGDPGNDILGCEPGDMTKRMAIPWQADFFDCSVQTPSLVSREYNQDDETHLQRPPVYLVYWWPPQSPYNVFTGSIDPNEQVVDALVAQNTTTGSVMPAGQNALYHRGISSFNDTVQDWSMLGFILNEGTEDHPYYVEMERDSAALGQALQNAGSTSRTTPVGG